MRFAALLEYDGTAYHGWQRQASQLVTLQETIETALSKVADEAITVVCAGRTDAGVHAKKQVIHFDSNALRTTRAWILGSNHFLPHDITLYALGQMPDDFHARFSAQARQYQYRIYNHPVRSARERWYTTWHAAPLDAELMHQAAQKLVGEHDFSSFRAKDCQAKSPIKNLEFLNVYRQDSLVIIDIKANAFLHHMVRNIADVLMCIGSGRAQSDWLDELLMVKSRTAGGATARATGLHFMDVFYPQSFSLPQSLHFS
jgi:tRNA pseudouridine38-40 synthase